MTDPAVWVVIPWRPGCHNREAAKAHVCRWWAENYPSWRVVIGEWPAERGPWRKGCAVRAAKVEIGDRDIVVVTDADVIPTGVGDAVAAISSPRAGQPRSWWSMPFRGVFRLTAVATELVIAGRYTLPTGNIPRMTGIIEERYVGSAGGGTVVLAGSVFAAIPIDPRFAGYGHEDLSWGLALHLLAGAPMMGRPPLWHLWHPPQPRMRRGSTVSRGVGSEASQRLWQRYREATTPAAMRVMVAEAEQAYAELMG